jgi:hypothetical protein
VQPNVLTKKYLFATVLAIAGTALKIYQWYFSKPLWVDEEMLLLNVRDRGFSELIGPLWLNQAAPLGWLAVQRWVLSEFGTNDRAVRAMPVLFGVATLWVALWMAQRWMKPLAAGTFVLLCGTAQWMMHYALEAKPYSADAFWALTLSAVAIWAAEPTAGRPMSLARTGTWWSIAAIGQWFSFGATFATLGSGLVLCTISYRRAGSRLAAAIALQSLIFLIVFAAHYAWSISYGNNDPYLRNYWWWGFPPVGAGVTATLQWLGKQIQPLSEHPGGTTLGLGLLLAAGYGAGISLMRHPALGLVILSVPITAFILAAFRILPLTDRLALWTVPAVYAAVALALDDLVARARAEFARRQWARFGVAMACAIVPIWVGADIVVRTHAQFSVGGTNHGLDDGRSIRLLMAQRQPGDVLLTTHLGLPAVWWYGKVPISDPNRGSLHPDDGAPIFEITHLQRGESGCQGSPRTQLARAVTGWRRAAIYLGFASQTPTELPSLVLDELSALGAVVAYRQVSEGIAAIFDLTLPPTSWRSNADVVGDRRFERAGPDAGCIGVRVAERW